MSKGNRALRVGAVVGSISLAAGVIWWQSSQRGGNRSGSDAQPNAIDPARSTTQPEPPRIMFRGSKSGVMMRDGENVLYGDGVVEFVQNPFITTQPATQPTTQPTTQPLPNR